jgi:hypothetical protein
MIDYEYEVLFVFDCVNVTALGYANNSDCSDGETLEQVAIRRAADTIRLALNVETDWADTVTARLTGSLVGGY